MALISWPEKAALEEVVICALCKRQRPLEEVYAGLDCTNGQVALACNIHFLSRSSFIRGWATFAIEQGQTIFKLSARTFDDDQTVY